jgi:hypothetical protein
MYMQNPDKFKWAGLAALMSGKIGCFNALFEYFAKSVALGKIKEWYDESNDLIKQNASETIAEWYNNSGDYVKKEIYTKVKKINDDIMAGNKAVFEDIFWQHIAFSQKGIAEIERLFYEKRLHKSAYEAWKLIANGKVWEGNLILLKYEQENVLQDIIYDTHPNSWWWSNLFTTEYLGIVVSPVPDHYNEFPGKDIANFEERWKWIVEDIMPAWESFETDANNRERLLEALREVCKDCCN